MSLNVYCPKCEGTYVELKPELVGVDIDCQKCGYQYTIPVDLLEEEAADIRRSFRRIFFWSALLALGITVLFLIAATGGSSRRGGPSPLLAVIIFPLYVYWFSALAFGFKALAVESGCLAILYLTFGNLGAIVGALFLGPLIGPIKALLMWLRLRRDEARLAELRGGRAGTAPKAGSATRSGPRPDQRDKRRNS